MFDTEHSGKIDYREFKAAMRALGYEIKKIEVERCFKEVDKDLSHSITFEEFVKIVTPRLHPKNSKEEIIKIFKLFDDDNTGKISLKNLWRVASELGESIPDEELSDLIKEASRGNDGLIGFDDFYRVMKKDLNDPLAEFDSDSD